MHKYTTWISFDAWLHHNMYIYIQYIHMVQIYNAHNFTCYHMNLSYLNPVIVSAQNINITHHSDQQICFQV